MQAGGDRQTAGPGSARRWRLSCRRSKKKKEKKKKERRQRETQRNGERPCFGRWKFVLVLQVVWLRDVEEKAGKPESGKSKVFGREEAKEADFRLLSQHADRQKLESWRRREERKKTTRRQQRKRRREEEEDNKREEREMKRAASITSKEAKKPKSTITAFFASSPGSGTATSAAPRAAFDKAKWTSSLTAEQRELLKLEIDTLDESWLAHLTDELLSREFLALKRFLRDEKKSGANIFPPEQDIYSWSRYTPLHKVKAVIIGQDPYHNHGQAHGLCFSVRPPTPAPPSLKNIYLALKNDYPAFEEPANRGGLLTPWAQQGVLLLNTCLTVRAHNANSHSQRGWERFTQRAIDLVARVRTKGVVFLAWGSPAGKRVSGVNKERHCVLQSVHPSPLSAHKGFLTCGHFKKANDWLQTRYGDEGIIDWSLTSKPLVTVTSVTTATETVKENGKTDTVSKTTAEERSDTISKTATVATTATATDAATTAITSKSTITKVDGDDDDADSDYGQDLIEDETK